MDLNVGIDDVGQAILQELWNQVAFQAAELVSKTKDVMLGKDRFQEFSRTILLLKNLLEGLNGRKAESVMGLEATRTLLEKLNGQLEKAHKIISECRSGSRLRLVTKSHAILSQMQGLAREIATTISSFQLVNLDTTLNIKSMTDQIIENLKVIEFQSASVTENIASQLEDSVTANRKNSENAMKILKKIAKTVGANANASLVQSELELLKREKEEMELQKKQAEAFQISQLIQLLYDTEIVKRPEDEEIAQAHQKYPTDSFTCPLCKVIMTDPVAMLCGHSFEKKAIQEYFDEGGRNCPTCREEPSSLVLTPNHSLKRSIDVWKQRDMQSKFTSAIMDINSNDISRQNKALEEMQVLMQMPRYTARAAEEELVIKLVNFLKDNRLNIKAALKCLYYLAKHSDEQKEFIVEVGAIRRIVKLIYKGETESDALAVLLELSEREVLGEKIGNYNDCIPLLVSLLNNKNQDVSQIAGKVLQNISFDTHFVIKMAESGYFRPFLPCFNRGPLQVREQMAVALVNMEVNEESMEVLKDKAFLHNLVRMLLPSSPECRKACLNSIKKLALCPKMAKRFLKDSDSIRLLLGIISSERSKPDLQKEAAECLALLVIACSQTESQLSSGLQELQSEHMMGIFLKLASSSDTQTKLQFLHLLVQLSCKFKMARDLIRSRTDAITHLFSSLSREQLFVRQSEMRLIYCISEGHPAGAPLPPSPAKEAAVTTLATILTSSPNVDERSIAAGIISQIPGEDTIVDEILCRSGVLKAIYEVISKIDNECYGIRLPASINTSLLENALAVLLRYTEPTKPELQKQVAKLEIYPSLVRVLSNGSPLAKERTAIALANLSKSASLSVSRSTNVPGDARSSTPLLPFLSLMSWCCSSMDYENLCSVHGTACSPRETFCLVKADAVKPLVRSLSETESGVAEASLTALETLLDGHSTLSSASAAIVDNQGVAAILKVLEKGSSSAKAKALDLFLKIFRHAKTSDIPGPSSQKLERLLIQLLQDDGLKKKAAFVLKQMDIIPEQSSYF